MNNRMGGSCSAQRGFRRRDENSTDARGFYGTNSLNDIGGRRSSVRHAVVSMVPDDNISGLYPVEDNYVLDTTTNRRSPKSLVNLCVDAICRSLPYLEGDLPPGLPQDVVDDILASLQEHSALNATTLRILKHCEVQALSLAKCRGVNDEWLAPLAYSTSSSTTTTSSSDNEEDEDERQHVSSCDSTTSSTSDVGSHPMTQHTTSVSVMDFDATHPQHGSIEVATTHDEEGEDENSILAAGDEDDDESFHSAASTHDLVNNTKSVDEGALSSSTSAFDTVMTATPSSTKKTDTSLYWNDDVDHVGIPSTVVDPAFGGHESSMPSLTARSPASSLTSSLTLLDLRGSTNLTDRGLLQLRDLQLLEVCRLDGCHTLTGKGLMALSQSYRLDTLSLANCRRLQDEAILNICHLPLVRHLILDGCRCLTDRSLDAIGNDNPIAQHLEKLDLTQCDLITDEGLESLDTCMELQELSLGWCRYVTNEGLDRLSTTLERREQLRVLRLARCSITDDGLAFVRRLTSLEELDLNGCNSISSAALGDTLAKLPNFRSLDVSYCPGILRSSWQGKIPNLKSLELCYSGVRDGHLSRLTNLPALEELNLDSCPVGDWAIAHLADNNVTPNLQSLDLADTDLTDMGMAHLPKFTQLTKLSLFYCNISNTGLRHLAKMKSLEVLNLDSRDVGDDGLHHLRNLPRLKALDVFSGRVTDTGCVHLSKIKSLETLELCGGGIGDLGCTILATIENLQSLNLSQNERITNRGAAALAALSNLKALNLSNTRVTSNALRFLSGLRQLQSLALYGCRGMGDTAAANLDSFQNGLPNLKCLRLNNAASERDGMMIGYDDDDEEDLEDAMASAAVPSQVMRRQHSLASDGVESMQHEDIGADDEMDDTSLYSNHS